MAAARREIGSRAATAGFAVPPPSRNAILRPFTTNVSDARTLYVTRVSSPSLARPVAALGLERGEAPKKRTIRATGTRFGPINRYSTAAINGDLTLLGYAKDAIDIDQGCSKRSDMLYSSFR